MAGKDLFDFEHLLAEFTASKTPECNILIDHYVNAFNDLSRFFALLGTAFGFISKDIDQKVGILKAHRSEHPDHFATVQSMVAYEVANGLTQAQTPTGLPSGARTLLRLHRTMYFVARFLGRLEVMDDAEPTSKAAAEEYKESLGQFHPWLVRKMAGLAMYALPTRGVFIQKYCRQEKEELERLVGPTATLMIEIADITQELYAENDLLELP